MEALAATLLEHEARALLTRLARLKPFALSETMVTAANLSGAAQAAIDRHLSAGREHLQRQVSAFIAGLGGAVASPATAQRRFSFLRLRFQSVLDQLDLFADALAQRSTRDDGVLLAGLDCLASDALALPAHYGSPPVVCYLDRPHGAAIRRARTRLPGGGDNPVAIIRVPRERMIGIGIAGSLCHEVGHQGAALLDLVPALRLALLARQRRGGQQEIVWRYWERCISEIIADFWSVARLGIAAPLGLLGVLSLPRAFVFRLTLDDPHPAPWLRVLLACAMGRALHPSPHWERVGAVWEALNPPPSSRDAPLLHHLREAIPALVGVLLEHRPRALRGRALAELFPSAPLEPGRLAATFDRWRAYPATASETGPTLACATIGQARADGRIGAEEESQLLTSLLTQWALRNTLNRT